MSRPRASRTTSALVSGLAAIVLVLALEAPSLASPPTGPPVTPTSVTLVGGNRSIAVSWIGAASGDTTFTATATSGGKVRSCHSKRTGCSIVALSNGLVYEVSVVAGGKGGASSTPSAISSVRVGVPGPPRMVRAMTGRASLSVSWSQPTASGVAKITSYMATTSPGGYSCSTAVTVLSQPGRSCVIAGLTSGVSYSVTVTATNAYGTGTPSTSTSGTPT